jgi:hypothetical protein
LNRQAEFIINKHNVTDQIVLKKIIYKKSRCVINLI